MTGDNVQRNEYLWKLLHRAKSGETIAFNEFFNELYTPVYRYLLIRLKHKETAEDCTQITFSKIFQNIQKIEQNVSSPLQYLFTVARNTLIDEKRKKQAETLTEEAWGTYISPENTEKKVENETLYAAILESIETLGDEEKDLLTFRLLENLSHAEIANMLEKSDVSIRKAFSRALEKLREKLKNKGITYEI
jgi:RNA polymerase sigma-70 factor (ECF subfamily)